MNSDRKQAASKTVQRQVWTDDVYWTVQRGELRRGRGRPGKTERLFRAVAEKLPFDALDEVEQDIEGLDVGTSGIYVAHDSMGTPRYIGRGAIFTRLRAHRKAHPHELIYFSFYVVSERVHEREIETLLIRAAGPSLHFNERKKRVDIEPGNVRDFEGGTRFFERQRRRGRPRKRAKR